MERRRRWIGEGRPQGRPQLVRAPDFLQLWIVRVDHRTHSILMITSLDLRTCGSRVDAHSIDPWPACALELAIDASGKLKIRIHLRLLGSEPSDETKTLILS